MATASIPPIEAQIREAIAGEWEGDYNPSGPDTPRESLRCLIARLADPFVDSAARTLESGGGSAWEPLRSGVGPAALWSDLRPSEAVQLIELLEAARDRASKRCEAIILEELVAAGLRFAAEHPDAPRASKAAA